MPKIKQPHQPSEPEDDLDEPDSPTLLLHDLEVLEELRAADFTGPDWDAHAEETFGYAFRVVRRWGLDGSLFTKMRADTSIAKRDRDRLPSRRRFDEGQIVDLIAHLMVTAIPVYQARLRSGSWRPEMGRRLRSYFVQQMKFQLARRYWSWVEQCEVDAKGPAIPLEPKHEVLAALHGDVYSWSDPMEAVVLADSIREEVSQAALGDPLTIRMVAMEASNFADHDIAAALGVTVKTVELRLRRFRQRAAKNRRVA